MTSTATLSSKYQISVPKLIRDELHWEAGQEFVFIPRGKGVLLMPVPELATKQFLMPCGQRSTMLEHQGNG